MNNDQKQWFRMKMAEVLHGSSGGYQIVGNSNGSMLDAADQSSSNGRTAVIFCGKPRFIIIRCLLSPIMKTLYY